MDIWGKIPMLYDNVVDSAISFSGITANLLESLLKAWESLRTVAFARSVT
jgi:hypothetical protein